MDDVNEKLPERSLLRSKEKAALDEVVDEFDDLV